MRLTSIRIGQIVLKWKGKHHNDKEPGAHARLILLLILVRILIFCQIEPTIHSSFCLFYFSYFITKKSIKSHVAQIVLHGSLLLKSWMVKIEWETERVCLCTTYASRCIVFIIELEGAVLAEMATTMPTLSCVTAACELCAIVTRDHFGRFCVGGAHMRLLTHVGADFTDRL